MATILYYNARITFVVAQAMSSVLFLYHSKAAQTFRDWPLCCQIQCSVWPFYPQVSSPSSDSGVAGTHSPDAVLSSVADIQMHARYNTQIPPQVLCNGF